MNLMKRTRTGLKLLILLFALLAVPLPGANVLPAATEVYASTYRINNTAIWMNAGKTRKLKVYGASGKVKWSSSNKKVAKVSSKGVVTAKKYGKATIYAKCAKLGKTVKCKVRVYSAASVKKKIMSLKKKYPEGLYWTNENNYYFWEAAYLNAYGCYAFIAEVSDAVFGVNAPIKTHYKFSKIKPGDHVRIGGHSVIVIEKKGNTLTVVEGNYNSSVHWGRKITKAQLEAAGFWVDTRYW